MPTTPLTTSLIDQASSNPSLTLALIAMFFLTASLLGGIGRVVFLALLSVRMLRFGAGIAILGVAAKTIM